MSLEKGISRLGTVFGVIFGLFLSLVVLFCSFELGLFNYIFDRHNEKTYQKQDRLNGDYVDDFVADDFQPDFQPGVRFLSQQPPIQQKLCEVIERPRLSATDLVFSDFPTFIMAILVVFIPFMLGLYGVKGIAKTFNWVVNGFRE